MQICPCCWHKILLIIFPTAPLKGVFGLCIFNFSPLHLHKTGLLL
jgi:hypothetical protein